MRKKREETEMKREKVTIYYNKTLFICGMIACFCCITPCCVFLFLLTDGFRKIVLNDTFFMFAAFLLLSFSMLIIAFYTGCNAHMVFTKDGVEYRQIFRKTEVHTYKEYPYVNKAFYPYYGIPVYYMVLSNRRLRDAELCQINNVRVGPGMIKIRYNKKNYERLLSIVPSRIALSLQAQFKDIPPKRFNFCI